MKGQSDMKFWKLEMSENVDKIASTINPIQYEENFESIENGNRNFELKIKEIILKHDPDRINEVGNLVIKYKGFELELIQKLKKKYELNIESHQYYFLYGAQVLLRSGPLNLLLIATPLAFISKYCGFSDSITFIFALLSIAPFAERLGFVTEQISFHTSETIGGLLNATFGNATELIISIAALYKGYYRLVQLSLLGSVLSNLLLVLGSAFLLGGTKYKIQKFDKITSLVNSSLLLTAVAGVLLPTVMVSMNQIDAYGQLCISRITSLVTFSIYIAYLYFQLVTHPDASCDKISTDSENDSIVGENQLLSNNPENLLEYELRDLASSEEVDEEEDEDILGMQYAIFWLLVITIFISILSDIVVDTVEKAASNLHIPSVFISTIIIPIIGNAAEHASAIIFAFKNKLNITLGIAVGSSTQIAMMVLPLLVIIGWILNKPMSLNFGTGESFSFLIAVVATTISLKDGVSNWLLGANLIGLYILISTSFWYHNDEKLS